MLLTPAIVTLEGPHRVGKSSMLHVLSQRTQYFDVYVDRGIASNYAFNVLYGRRQFDLLLAWQLYFANPAACLLHFSLGYDDYEADVAASAERRERWVGLVPHYDNRRLDELIAEAVAVARSVAPGRVRSLRARSASAEALADEVLLWLDTVRKLPSIHE